MKDARAQPLLAVPVRYMAAHFADGAEAWFPSGRKKRRCMATMTHVFFFLHSLLPYVCQSDAAHHSAAFCPSAERGCRGGGANAVACCAANAATVGGGSRAGTGADGTVC